MSLSQIPTIAATRQLFFQNMHKHKEKYILQGTLFIVLGVLAASLPMASALSAELIIGVVLLLSGILQMALTLKSHIHWWSLLSSLLSIATGILMVWKPFSGLLAIITIMAVFMTIEGIFELLLALQFRSAKNWSWMLFSGLTTLLLALIMWLGYPAFDVLYLGWVIAINFILYGVSLIMLVWRLNK